jgi:hypothetical protein
MSKFDRFEDALRVRASLHSPEYATDFMVGYLLSMVQSGSSYQFATEELERTIINFVPYHQDEQPLVDLMWQNVKTPVDNPLFNAII